MAQLGNTFIASEIPEGSDYSPLPVGDYRVEIVASELRATKAGDGQYLLLEMQILDGDYSGRRIWDRLNLWNNNPTTVEIAQRTLASICRAVGVPSINDSEELHLRPFVAKARMTKNKQGEMQNLWSYRGEGDETSAPPARAAQANQTASSRPAPAAQAKPSGKPWERKR